MPAHHAIFRDVLRLGIVVPVRGFPLLKISFAGAALLLIGACAGAMGVKGEAGMPVLDETTGKTADRVANCIGDRLEAQNPELYQTRFSVNPTFDGYSITGTQGLKAGDDTILLIDVVKLADQTRVRMYTHFLIGKGPSAYLRAVRDCL